MSISPGASRDGESVRLTPRPPVPVGGDHDASFFAGNLVGRAGSGLDEARGIEPGEASLREHDLSIASALAGAEARTPHAFDDRLPDGAGDALVAGLE